MSREDLEGEISFIGLVRFQAATVTARVSRGAEIRAGESSRTIRVLIAGLTAPGQQPDLGQETAIGRSV